MTGGWKPGALVACVDAGVVEGKSGVLSCADYALTAGEIYTLATAPYTIEGFEVVAVEEARSSEPDGGFLKSRFRLIADAAPALPADMVPA